MNLVLHLNLDIEVTLTARAAMTGKSPEELALQALQDKFGAEPRPEAELSAEEWRRQFDGWVGAHRSRNPQVDDSRESIYADRG